MSIHACWEINVLLWYDYQFIRFKWHSSYFTTRDIHNETILYEGSRRSSAIQRVVDVAGSRFSSEALVMSRCKMKKMSSAEKFKVGLQKQSSSSSCLLKKMERQIVLEKSVLCS